MKNEYILKEILLNEINQKYNIFTMLFYFLAVIFSESYRQIKFTLTFWTWKQSIFLQFTQQNLLKSQK